MRVLALGENGRALGTITWQRAMTLSYEGKVVELAWYDIPIRSPSIQVQMPAVVIFKKGTRPYKQAMKYAKYKVYLRDNGDCQYCGNHVPRAKWQLDHVHPRSKGGITTWTNVVVACPGCNQSKGNKTLEEAGMKLLRLPVRPKVLPDASPVLWNESMPEVWKDFLTADSGTKISEVG